MKAGEAFFTVEFSLDSVLRLAGERLRQQGAEHQFRDLQETREAPDREPHRRLAPCLARLN